MAEAVVVAVARSPIGRAFKGSMVSIRPDDLTVQMIAAALAKVPQLDPADIDDIMLGCGLPGGEQGYNMARVVAIMLGYDTVPGTTVTRYCSSSLQTTRMAYHAIKAGEGDVFVSAGVECVSRFAHGSSDSWPDTKNTFFAAAEERTAEEAKGGAGIWQDPRQDNAVPDVYLAMGQTAENVAGLRGVTRAEQDEFGVRSQNLAEKALADGFWQRDITPVTLPDGRVVSADDGPRAVVGAHHGAVREGDGGDVPLPEPVGEGLLGQVLRPDTELILGLPRDPAQRGDVLRGLAHGDVDIRDRGVLAGVVPDRDTARRERPGPGLRVREEVVVRVGPAVAAAGRETADALHAG